MPKTKRFSVCIPAYKRAQFLAPLLDSIYEQDFKDFEIVICEDDSPERSQIAEIVRMYQGRHPGSIRYQENEANLGFDGNIRRLVECSEGDYCFFMGNDDLMCPGALAEVAMLLDKHKNIGLVLKSYAWFDETPDRINQTVQYFPETCLFKAGKQAIHACFRRSGVIAGYVIHRERALAAATTKFDGSLFYQMHLTGQVLATMDAVFTPKVLVLCRNGVPPDFGHNTRERGKYVPGSFTPEARLNMVGGALDILRDLRESTGIDAVDEVMNDYSNFFYPCIKDQLKLPFGEYWRLYRRFGDMGFRRYPMFHLYSIGCFLLGERGSEVMIRTARRLLGRSPQFGGIFRA